MYVYDTTRTQLASVLALHRCTRTGPPLWTCTQLVSVLIAARAGIMQDIHDALEFVCKEAIHQLIFSNRLAPYDLCVADWRV